MHLKTTPWKALLFILFIIVPQAKAAASRIIQTGPDGIYGTVRDSKTLLPVAGASVLVEGTTRGVVTDADGNFSLERLAAGTYILEIRMITYKTFKSDPLVLKSGQVIELDVALAEDVSMMDNIVVVAHMPVGTDAGLITRMREAKVVASGVSAQQIGRTQDKDASEVVRRIPGISIIDDKFVIVRGLNQRYNNTWINGVAAPSSDADSRAFSFDVIPSSQIDNIIVVKTPAAEYPADYTGGFVMVKTRTAAESNAVHLSYGVGINDKTHFRDFLYNKGGATDFLGFDNGKRDLRGVPGKVLNTDNETIDRISREGFNNDWKIRTKKPVPDQKFNFALNRSFRAGKQGDRLNMAVALNYSYSSKTLLDMENSLYGVYDAERDAPNQKFSYTDDQYTTDVRLGGMANFTYVRKGRNGRGAHTYEFGNIVNQLGRDRYTVREGWRNVSGYYDQQQEEYLYQSRTSYTGHLSGKHDFGTISRDRLEWTAGYSYSNRYQPDRRIIERKMDPSNGVEDYEIEPSSVSRVFTWLDENGGSGAVNYKRNFNFGGMNAELRTGIYADIKSRKYRTRDFLYKWNLVANSLPEGFATLPTADIFTTGNLGSPDKIHVQDDTDNTNNYDARSGVYAAYAAVDIPLGRFDIYAGLRFERSDTRVTSFTQVGTDKTKDDNYIYNNVFPSLNASYNIDRRSLVRFAYGMTVNRPEFRELSTSTYFDFEMFSTIMGNPDLKQAVVQNLDVRYEFYPSSGETVSLALFFKHFKNPIEWTYMDAGGTYQYSFTNALSARTYGIELDVRKKLDFIGLDQLTLTANVAFMKSRVKFEDASLDHDRPMQGQSPYLLNAGLFYQHPSGRFSAGAMYNRIGKRIVGLGRVESSDGSTFNNNIPDLYELPRDVLDVTLGVKLSRALELKLAARDVIAQRVTYSQEPKFMDMNGKIHKRKQTPRSYDPGRNFTISLTANF